MKSWKKYVAEFLGTMILVVFACGIAMFSSTGFPASKILIIALGFGLTATYPAAISTPPYPSQCW